MSLLFIGQSTVVERLTSPVDTIPDMYFSVNLSKPLLSPELVEKLNPLVLKVHSATNMPDKPVSYGQLRARHVCATRLCV